MVAHFEEDQVSKKGEDSMSERRGDTATLEGTVENCVAALVVQFAEERGGVVEASVMGWGEAATARTSAMAGTPVMKGYP